jgi:hypothetical protein
VGAVWWKPEDCAPGFLPNYFFEDWGAALADFFNSSFCRFRRAILSFLSRWNLALSPLMRDISGLLKQKILAR